MRKALRRKAAERTIDGLYTRIVSLLDAFPNARKRWRHP
jgi:hypothetical protein